MGSEAPSLQSGIEAFILHFGFLVIDSTRLELAVPGSTCCWARVVKEAALPVSFTFFTVWFVELASLAVFVAGLDVPFVTGLPFLGLLPFFGGIIFVVWCYMFVILFVGGVTCVVIFLPLVLYVSLLFFFRWCYMCHNNFAGGVICVELVVNKLR